jgi:hypothetical protein
VHVVGPSAVLGSEIGSHLWVHPGTGQRFYLPVKRGPDTSLPQRALLPYWDGAVMRRWSNAGARVADNDEEWYGGPLRERVLSGFGPYSLTRLALQTGGTFTLYDRRADRGRYRLEDLRPYFPDYGTHQQYLNAMENRPLRQAVHQVAVFTHLQAQNLYQPQFGFFGSRGTTYPYSAFRVYYRQDRFRRLLGPALAAQGKRALAANLIIRNALQMLEPRGVNMESEYQRESSKRWRAWYDLNRGRLLAQSVRFREYAKACDLIVSNMNRALLPSTNYLLFYLDTPLRARTKSDAEEAVRLLKRCVESNPDTPWADFALGAGQTVWGQLPPVRHSTPTAAHARTRRSGAAARVDS